MKALLIQLPVPKLTFGLNTGNIPLGPACLKQAAADLPGCRVEMLSPDLASHGGDGAIAAAVAADSLDLVGFTVFSWNRDRSVFLAQKIKEATGARILFGGPEITDDTVGSFPDHIDLCVIGEGEEIFRQLLTRPDLWKERIIQSRPGRSLLAAGSPCVSGHLPLGRDGVMLLETQRGCPYRCGFCYYSKARKQRDVAPDAVVLDGLTWALENGVKEIYLLDPSLNARPGLEKLLAEITTLNRSARIPLTSEIRAESVAPAMAERYAGAGFTSFEVGLQSINPGALKAMNRPTDLDKFTAGIHALKVAGISPTIDLIFGLPGDTPEGFRHTVDFILENGMDDHVQVFPLLVLPGTAFRKNSQSLGLEFSPHPPYPVIRTPGFSEADLEEALDYAEEAFDRAFYPFPDLDLAVPNAGDHYVNLAGVSCLAKLVLEAPRPTKEIRPLARQITSPFQIFLSGPAAESTYAAAVIDMISSENPFVPMEIVFMEPAGVPDIAILLAASQTPRPHFLDLDLRWLYPEPGSRSLLFTLVSKRRDLFFQGPMKRQVFLWEHSRLPEMEDLEALPHLDGLLIAPAKNREEKIARWQDRMAGRHEDIMAVSFADMGLQTRWTALTQGDRIDLPSGGIPSPAW